MILLIDNYDSFTHNLYQLIASIGLTVQVVRNDCMTLKEITALNPQAIVLSPGPGRPEEAGICLDVVRTFAPSIPLFGVCLGHQAIGLAFGGQVIPAPQILHGKKTSIFHRRKGLFKGIALPCPAGRYHSLVVDKKSLPDCLMIEAEDADEVIMAIKHKAFPCYGVQFHPESILTSQGELLIRNFLQEAGICDTERDSKIGISAAPKPRGSTIVSRPHISNIGQLTIVEPRELSRQPKSDFRITFGIDLKQTIEKLLKKEDLSREESAQAIQEILNEANSHQIAAFLMLMRAKGETVDELQGAIEAMRTLMIPVPIAYPVLDIVGTGGDGAHTLNISTASAILAASCGVKIAKHGNRSVSSRSGSADVLEALGVAIHQTPEQINHSLEEIGIGFMFAPDFHPALKQVKEVRTGLNVHTLFNMIGPLLNPAQAEHLMLGVFSEELLEIVASLLFRLKTHKSFVFHGGGIDELSCIGPAKVLEVTKTGIRSFILDPTAFGLKKCTLEDLRGKDAQYNAEKILQTFAGQEGPFADTIVLNAGVALYLYGSAESIQKGIELAQTSLKEKKALECLNQWISSCLII